MDYIGVEEAINAPGLRLVLTAGVPGPWGEAAKAMLDFKGMAYTPVLQEGGGENSALHNWTGQTSAPVAVYEDLPPACHWLDLLMLLERLQPEPALVPAQPLVRARVIGLSALVAGAEGFGWQRRLGMIAPMMQLDDPPEMARRLAGKYGYSAAALAEANAALQSISACLDDTLAAQAKEGSDYFVGEGPTAVDFYWANFAGLLKPLPPADNPMPDWLRATYEATEPDILACLTRRLEAHRDMMYQRHIKLPLDY
jgi:glutathione S-transferase